MKGWYLKFYVHELRKHHGVPLFEWLLDQAKDLGIQGGSAFRAVAGFGRHGLLQEERFFELAGDLPVEVVFALDEAEAGRLLELLQAERLCLFYAKMPAEYGLLNAQDQPAADDVA